MNELKGKDVLIKLLKQDYKVIFKNESKPHKTILIYYHNKLILSSPNFFLQDKLENETFALKVWPLFM